MSMHHSWPQRLLVLLVLAITQIAGIAGAATSPGAPARAGAEPLDVPAQISSRAQRSVLLAVTRAEARLVAVGERGIVLLSDDNGVAWRQAKVPTSVGLTNVQFVSSRTGWAVGHGGIVLKTTDGGETWARQFDGREAAQRELESARAEAAAGSPGAERHLRDAEQLLADGPDKPLLDLHFADEQNGVVVGAYGLIFATADGGKTWQSLRGRLDNPKGKHLYSIRASGAQLYVAGEQGALYRSGDGGKSFTEVKTPYVGTFFGTLTAPGGELIVYGLRGNAFRSADQGSSWQKVGLGLPVTITAATRLADGALVLVDETGRVLGSRDGGLSFTPIPVPQPSPFTGVAQAADGGLIVSGARGMTRLVANSDNSERKK